MLNTFPEIAQLVRALVTQHWIISQNKGSIASKEGKLKDAKTWELWQVKCFHFDRKTRELPKYFSLTCLALIHLLLTLPPSQFLLVKNSNYSLSFYLWLWFSRCSQVQWGLEKTYPGRLREMLGPYSTWILPPQMSGHILIHLWKHSWRNGRVMGTFPPSWNPFSKGLCDVMVMTCPHGEIFDKFRLDYCWWLPIRDHIECAQFLLPQSELYYKNMISFTLKISQTSNRKAGISILILYTGKRNEEKSRDFKTC